MARFVMIAAFLPLMACGTGDGNDDFLFPEDCDNGIDDNGNGLVDCDDDQCGGPACLFRDTGTTGPGVEPLEIMLPDEELLTYTFDQQDCNRPLQGTITVINRTDEDGAFDMNCENPPREDSGGFDTAFSFSVTNEPWRNSVNNEDVESESQVEVRVRPNCYVQESFAVQCTATVEADNRTEDISWTIEGIWVGD